MKYYVFNVCIMFSLIFLFTSCYQRDEFPILKGRYLGQKPPGMTPEVFAPGIVSTGTMNRAIHSLLMERRFITRLLVPSSV